jgi:hypothetical protein
MTLTDLLTYDNFALGLIGVAVLRGLYRKTFAPVAGSAQGADTAPPLGPATAHSN